MTTLTVDFDWERAGEVGIDGGKPAFPALGREPIFGAQLDRGEREALVARLRARPHEYVGQEEVPLSTAPVLDGDRLRPRHVGTRCYLVAADEGYAIMPGGLTRVAYSDESLVVSMQRGGGSKDTWVLSEEPVSDFSVSNLGVQLRYRYEFAPLSYVYVVYGRGGFEQENTAPGSDQAVRDSFSLRDDEQLLIKVSYRFET